MTFRRFQKEVMEWAANNFEEHVAWHALLGLMEEVGELSHAHLKTVQNIRGKSEDHFKAKIDAVGDIVIFLADYCAMSGIDFEEAIADTWEGVKKRDWNAHPKTGLPRITHSSVFDIKNKDQVNLLDRLIRDYP